MNQTWFVRAAASVLFLASTVTPIPVYSQHRSSTGEVAGSVLTERGAPIEGATIAVARTEGGDPSTAVAGASGAFRTGPLAPGLYRVTVRRIGYREARLAFLRVTAGQTAEIRVVLTASPTQLSTVQVRVTPTSIDASTTELTQRLEVADLQLVPIGRDAASLVDLVPGARKGFVWGGAGDAANNYQLDGVAANHPGVGGDFLSPSIDWIEALEVRGLGAGAEHGGFQGGIINAVTKTGSNERHGALRTNYVSPSLTASNSLPNEEGAEQTMRRELSTDMRGPIVRDRLFFFLGAVMIDRSVQVPDLLSAEPTDVRRVEQEFRDMRGIGKLTFRPGPLDRIDALIGHTQSSIDRAGLNGIDDPAAALRVRSPTTFYELAWARTVGTATLDAKLVGFTSRQSSVGYAGDSVPGVQIFTTGRQPIFQNALFNARTRPGSLGGNVTWRKETPLLGGVNRLVLGAEYTRGSWRMTRTRNGGLTWFPYLNPSTGTVDPLDARRWADAASEWGGEIRIRSDVEDFGAFLQDYLTVRPNLTITPGLRFGRWFGWLNPADGSRGRFLAAHDAAIDPRIGVVWDISGRNDFVVKAHWGRYHQSMSSLFFDRAEGGNAYTNERFYFQGPDLTSSRTVYTPSQRDAQLNPFTGFSPLFAETILNEAGAVVDYRQPYVQQVVASVEKRFGPRWKAELSLANRSNRDIVGLVDRNLEQNYSAIRNVSVRHRIAQVPILDQYGNPLVLPQIWVSNFDLREELIRRRNSIARMPPVPGFTFDDIDRLKWDPDIVLSTVPGAKRGMTQLSASLRTEQTRWNGFASATLTDLRGNVDGLTGFGTTGADFTAGPGVRMNERENYEGRLANAPLFEAKSWLTGQLPWGFRGGTFVNFTLGEHFTPSFRFTPRHRLLASDRTILADSLFIGVLGQTLLIEERGARHYGARANVDVRLEKRMAARGFTYVLSGDLFNALGSDAIVQANLTVNDGISTDPTSVFGAPRRRVTPMRLQLGARVEF